jgi:ATP-dependent Clp protease ATP-binding subunit ClpB
VELEGNIKQKLYGQDSAVDSVLERVYINFAGIANEKKPMASFLFLGPTGTGKTELARLLSDNLDMKLLKYDMSEFQERHSVSGLIGAPPGYVGFEDGNVGGGKLISDISKHPFSILLFDEIEKAHPDVTNILLQMLDEGVLTSSNGKKVNCKNTIIIMTTNMGSNIIAENFDGLEDVDAEKRNSIIETTKLEVLEELKKHVRPEFLNRIDETVMFTMLNRAEIKQILMLLIKGVTKRLTDQGYQLELNQKAVDYLADLGYEPAFGARPMKRVLQRELVNELSKALLAGSFIPGDSILVDLDSTGQMLTFVKK